MPKTWSNNKVTGPIPVRLNEKERRRKAAPFVLLLVFITILFGSILTWTMIRTYSAPPQEMKTPAAPPSE